MDSPEDYLKKYIQRQIDEQIRNARLPFQEKLDEAFKLHQQESERLVEYKELEGFTSNFDKELHDSLSAGQFGYIRGSFMEYAAPYMSVIEKAIESTKSKINALERLESAAPESSLADKIAFAKEVLVMIETDIQTFEKTPIYKFKNNPESGKEWLSNLSADINALYKFLVSILQSTK